MSDRSRSIPVAAFALLLIMLLFTSKTALPDDTKSMLKIDNSMSGNMAMKLRKCPKPENGASFEFTAGLINDYDGAACTYGPMPRYSQNPSCQNAGCDKAPNGTPLDLLCNATNNDP